MMKKLLFFMTLLLSVVVSCENDQTMPNADVVRPSFTTIAADKVGDASALLVSQFSYDGAGKIYEVGFALKKEATDGNYSDRNSDIWGSGKALLALKGLDFETEYRYYSYMIIGGERFNSISHTFKTLKDGEVPMPSVPIFGSPLSSDVTKSSATIACDLSYMGEGEISEIGFEYQKGDATAIYQVKLSNTVENKSAELTGLAASLKCTYYLYAVLDGKKYQSERANFTTLEEGVAPPAGDGTTVMLDFSSADVATPAFPGKDASGTVGTHTIGGYAIKISSEKYYWWANSWADNAPNLFIGRQGAYIEFPMVEGQALSQIKIMSSPGASALVKVEVKDASAARDASTRAISGGAGELLKGESTTLTLAGTDATKAYRLYIVEDKNAQLANIELIYGEGGENPDPDPNQPTISANPTSLSFTTDGGSKTIACTTTNEGTNSIVATSSSTQFTASVSSKTVTITAKANTGIAGVSSVITLKLGSAETKINVVQEGVGGELPDLGAKHNGWAELVSEIENSDYMYAYHITDVASGKGYDRRNYGVCFSKRYKCPVWVSAPMHDVYAVPNVSRTNAYKDDPKMSSTYQVGKWSGSPYNRGHMLGSAERLMSRKTNEQVFYHSNIGPQYMSNFNTGGGSWNNFEAYIDTQWRGCDTLYQVIGCLFEGTLDVQNGTSIPSHYYSVMLRAKKNTTNSTWVVDLPADEIQCAAFVVEHKNQRGIKAQMFTIEEFEKRTGHKFFVNVPNAPKTVLNKGDWNYN